MFFKGKMRLLCLLLVITSLFMGCGSKVNDQEVSNKFNLEDALWCKYSQEYLNKLRTEYNLDEIVKDCSNDFEKVEAITKWVTNLWKHDGKNTPEEDDPIFILDKVTKEGEEYRCVEYGKVIDGCLNSLGIPARTIYLRTEDAETREYGASHVGTEAYLKEYDKWIFIDGQWGAIPMLDNEPLNALEFSKALKTNKDKVYVNWAENIYKAEDEEYYSWIEEYLYYLYVDCYFKDSKDNIVSKSIMFVPKGGQEISIFQRVHKIDVDEYTRDEKYFYTCPKL